MQTGSRGRTSSTGDAMSLKLDPLRKGLFILLVINISRIHQHFGFLVPLRPALIVTAFVGAYAYANPRYLANGSVFRTWPAKLMVGLGIMSCLSVPLGISIGHAALFILDSYWKVLLGAFLLIAAIRKTEDLHAFVWALVVSSGALAYLSLFVFRMVKARDDSFARLAGGYSYDANDIGCVAVVGMSMTLLTYQTSGKRGKLVSMIVLLGLAMTVAKTGSRGAFVGLMALGVALLILLKNVSLDKRLAFMVLAVVGIAIAAPPGYMDQMVTVFHPKDDYNWKAPTGRKAVAKRGMGYMASRPIAGVGIDNFQMAEGLLSSEAVARKYDPTLPGLKWSVAHNSFVQAGAELGVPGFLLFIALVLGPIIGLTRQRTRLPSDWSNGDVEQRFLYYCCVYLPVGYVGFAFSGFFVSFAYSDLVYVMTALVAGTYICIEHKLESPQAKDPGNHPLLSKPWRGGLPPMAPDVDDGPRYAPRPN